MPNSQNDSLLFSLKALEQLETDRIEQERAAKERARIADERHRARMERVAREAEMRRVEEEEKRRLDAERARREEEARLEAEKQAAIVRARAEVEAVASAERARFQAAHEVELVKARGVAAQGRYRFLLGLSVVAVLAIGAFAGVLSKELHEAKEKDQQEDVRQASALESAQKDRAEAEAALRGARQEIGDLRERLRFGSSPATAPVGPTPSVKSPGGKAGPHKASKHGDSESGAPCDENDPICGHLPGKKK